MITLYSTLENILRGQCYWNSSFLYPMLDCPLWKANLFQKPVILCRFALPWALILNKNNKLCLLSICRPQQSLYKDSIRSSSSDAWHDIEETASAAHKRCWRDQQAVDHGEDAQKIKAIINFENVCFVITDVTSKQQMSQPVSEMYTFVLEVELILIWLYICT